MAAVSTEPDAAEVRVLGALLEKQRTTPEAYPLSVNALRLACNQSTNRVPVVDLDERTVLDALERLSRRRWVRLASGAGSRARKYRHLLGEALSVGEPQLALLCVLMLRGPQTPGELKQRTERLRPFADPAAVEETLEGLIERGLATRLERRPGQKEQRYRQLIGEPDDEQAVSPSAHPTPTSENGVREDTQDTQSSPSPDEERLGRLEAELADVRAQLAELRRELGS